MKRLLLFAFFLCIALLVFPDNTNAKSYVNPNQTYTYEEMTADIKNLGMAYPELITYKSLGKTPFGREMWAVGVGRGDATLFINSSHHAREWLTTNIAMEMIDQYSESYVNNSKIDGYSARSLLNEVTIWFVPMVNPDGVTLQQSGLNAFPSWTHQSLIKMNNGSKNFKRWKANAQGIDLNRQYPAGWELKSGLTNSYMNYPGKRALEAPEAAKLAAFTYWVDPEITVSYHSSGRTLFWNYKVKKGNYDRDYTIAKKVGNMTGYSLVMPTSTPSGSGYKDWFIETFDRPGLTPEISYYVPNTNPPISVFPEEWRRNKAVGLYLAQESDKLWEKKVTHVNKTITTFDTKSTLNRPDPDHASRKTIKPGVYTVDATKDKWLRVSTGTGKTWVYASSFVYGEVSNVNEPLLLLTKKTLFSMPLQNKNTKVLIDQQIVTAKKKWNNWYLINTTYGDRWITDASVLKNYSPTTINETYKLLVPKVAWEAPVYTAKRTSLQKNTVINATQQWNGWIRVQFDGKHYWMRKDHTLESFNVNNSTENVNQEIVLLTNKVLFNLPSYGSNSGKSVKAGTYQVVRKMNNWYGIETSYGTKWVSHSSAITDNQTKKIDTKYELVKPKVAHSIPSGSAAVRSIPVGTIVQATSEWEDWTSVIYDQQTYWLRTDSVLKPFTVEQSTEPIDQELVLITRKTLFTLPSYGSNTNESVEPMIVKATRQRGNWYAFNTVNGERWISSASVITDYHPTAINQQYKLSQEKRGFTIPSTTAESLIIAKDSVVTGKQTWKDWILVEYSGKEYWVKTDATLVPYSPQQNMSKMLSTETSPETTSEQPEVKEEKTQ
ncbi:M14 family zinc carboxypeptidase [Metabacillus sp. FJAT-53654]|uniref:M14 family zinc carboxypeptidase n=1 Tax=Metabacillus rhizosphaerae TaxID=3117747 RepID=A0ABZ2MWQ1_9BACI